jgi:hypothetical protein
LFIDNEDYTNVAPSLLHTFGTPGDGLQVLNYLLDSIRKNALTWTSEPGIITQLVKCLKCFSFNKKTRTALLESSRFNTLVTDMLNQLSKLPCSVQSLFVETIATIATHANTEEKRNLYFSHLSLAIDVCLFFS